MKKIKSTNVIFNVLNWSPRTRYWPKTICNRPRLFYASDRARLIYRIRILLSCVFSITTLLVDEGFLPPCMHLRWNKRCRGKPLIVYIECFLGTISIFVVGTLVDWFFFILYCFSFVRSFDWPYSSFCLVMLFYQ